MMSLGHYKRFLEISYFHKKSSILTFGKVFSTPQMDDVIENSK